MTKHLLSHRKKPNLVYTPEKGLVGLIDELATKYATLGVDLPLQVSLYAPNLEIYTGVTWWRDCSSGDICSPIDHSPEFRIQRIGLVTRKNKELAERLFEMSKGLFKRFNLSQGYTEDLQLGQLEEWDEQECDYRQGEYLGKWLTWNGFCVYATKDNKGRFNLVLGETRWIGEDVPTKIINDFDTLISDCVGEIYFDKVKGQHPSADKDKFRRSRYYVRHASLIHGD